MGWLMRIPVPPPGRAHGDRRTKRLRTRADEERYSLDMELDPYHDDILDCGHPAVPGRSVTFMGEDHCSQECADQTRDDMIDNIPF